MFSLPVKKHSGYIADFAESRIPENEHDILATKLVLNPRDAKLIGSAFPDHSKKSVIGLYELKHYLPSHNHNYYLYFFFTGRAPLEFLRISQVKLNISETVKIRLVSYCREIHTVNDKLKG